MSAEIMEEKQEDYSGDEEEEEEEASECLYLYLRTATQPVDARGIRKATGERLVATLYENYDQTWPADGEDGALVARFWGNVDVRAFAAAFSRGEAAILRDALGNTLLNRRRGDEGCTYSFVGRCGFSPSIQIRGDKQDARSGYRVCMGGGEGEALGTFCAAVPKSMLKHIFYEES